MDTVKNYELGTVVSVETVPAQALIQDHEDKAFVLAGIEGYEDALVTVEAPYTEGEDSLLLGGGFKLRVAYVRGSGYMGSGPVVSIERGEKG